MRNNKATTHSKKKKRLQEKVCNQSTATWLCNGQYLVIMMQRWKLHLVLELTRRFWFIIHLWFCVQKHCCFTSNDLESRSLLYLWGCLNPGKVWRAVLYRSQLLLQRMFSNVLVTFPKSERTKVLQEIRMTRKYDSLEG